MPNRAGRVSACCVRDRNVAHRRSPGSTKLSKERARRLCPCSTAREANASAVTEQPESPTPSRRRLRGWARLVATANIPAGCTASTAAGSQRESSRSGSTQSQPTPSREAPQWVRMTLPQSTSILHRSVKQPESRQAPVNSVGAASTQKDTTEPCGGAAEHVLVNVTLQP